MSSWSPTGILLVQWTKRGELKCLQNIIGLIIFVNTDETSLLIISSSVYVVQISRSGGLLPADDVKDDIIRHLKRLRWAESVFRV